MRSASFSSGKSATRIVQPSVQARTAATARACFSGIEICRSSLQRARFVTQSAARLRLRADGRGNLTSAQIQDLKKT